MIFMQMKTFKKKALFMALLLGSMALTACGGGRSSASSKKSESTPASQSASASNSDESSANASEESSSSSKKRRSSSKTEDEIANLPEYEVKIDNGVDAPVVKNIKQGQPIEKPADPQAPAGKTFYGWKNKENGNQIWNFDDEWLNAVYGKVTLEPLFIDSSLVESRVEAELAPVITEANDGDGMDGATYSGGQKGRGLIYKAYESDFNIEPMYISERNDDEGIMQARYATSQELADPANASKVYGAFVHFLYVKGSKLTYKVNSSAAVENAVIFMKIASEYGHDDDPNDVNSSFTHEMFPIKVNGTAINYGTVTVHGIVLKEMMPFQDYLLSTTVSLNAGENTIEMEVDNDTLIFGTAGSTAPMIDCLKIYAPSALTVTNAKIANLDKDL